MEYETSFNMNNTTFEKIFNASLRTGISMKKLIIQMMYHYAKHHKKMQVEDGTVKYQNIDRRNNWRIFRISLSKKDYELFTDMRKVMKKSVSYLVALSIEKYLDQIVEQILQRLFNYTSLIHDSTGIRLHENIKEWIFTWEVTNDPPQATKAVT